LQGREVFIKIMNVKFNEKIIGFMLMLTTMPFPRRKS